jgi:CRP-like cAMP-binding protein
LLLQDRSASTNRFIDGLPATTRRRLLETAEVVPMQYKRTIAAHGEALRYVFFPTTSFISLLVPADRGLLEIAVVGREGFFGLPIALGVGESDVEAIVQGEGFALRMGAPDFRELLRDHRALRTHVDRYAFVMMGQLARNSVCNRFHLVEQRLARWLLMSADRAQAATFDVTQAFLAEMLGVRRVGVTTAARALQERRLIQYTRGVVTIRNREGLRKAACSCYAADLATYRSQFQ